MGSADSELDITGEVCPMTFVRTKLKLEKMQPGQVLDIRLNDGEPSRNVPEALRDHGQEVLGLTTVGPGVCSLRVRKCR